MFKVFEMVLHRDVHEAYQLLITHIRRREERKKREHEVEEVAVEEESVEEENDGKQVFEQFLS